MLLDCKYYRGTMWTIYQVNNIVLCVYLFLKINM